MLLHRMTSCHPMNLSFLMQKLSSSCCQTHSKNNNTYDKQHQSETGADYNRVEQKPVGIGFFLKPVVKMMPVNCAQGQGYMTMKNRQHKWKCEKDRAGECNNPVDIKQFTHKKIGPGKYQEQGN